MRIRNSFVYFRVCRLCKWFGGRRAYAQIDIFGKPNFWLTRLFSPLIDSFHIWIVGWTSSICILYTVECVTSTSTFDLRLLKMGFSAANLVHNVIWRYLFVARFSDVLQYTLFQGGQWNDELCEGLQAGFLMFYCIRYFRVASGMMSFVRGSRQVLCVRRRGPSCLRAHHNTIMQRDVPWVPIHKKLPSH